MIYIKENVSDILSRYIYLVQVSSKSANARFPYKDRYWITAYRYYDLLFFPERLYTQFLFTYLEHGQKEGRRRVPRFPRRKIETREHLRLIAPLPDQSSIFPVADQIRTISRFISQLFSVRLTKVCLSFSFFSLSLQVEAWFLSSLHFNLVALGSSYGKIINEKEKWWIWLVVVEGDTRSSRLNYAGC